MDKDDLCKVMSELYDSEINCGIESDWDGGWTVWLGDEMNGRDLEGYFENKNINDVAMWLSSGAVKIYPNSGYAKSKEVK